MIDANLEDSPFPPLTTRLLREFATLLTVLTLGLAGLSFWKHGGSVSTSSVVLLSIALLLGLPGIVHPVWVRPLYRLLMTVTRPIGHVVGLALLGLIYFVVLTPLALLLRTTGRDPLRLRKPTEASLWTRRWTEEDVRQYLRQYQRQVADPRAASTPSKRD